MQAQVDDRSAVLNNTEAKGAYDVAMKQAEEPWRCPAPMPSGLPEMPFGGTDYTGVLSHMRGQGRRIEERCSTGDITDGPKDHEVILIIVQLQHREVGQARGLLSAASIE